MQYCVALQRSWQAGRAVGQSLSLRAKQLCTCWGAKTWQPGSHRLWHQVQDKRVNDAS